jgi:2-dehydropantoate 2-reductase
MSGGILICGAGAVGGAVGAALVDAGHSVDFVDMDQDHVAALRDPERGLVVEGPVRTRSGAVRAWLPNELAGRWDKVMLCVKAHHTAEATAMIAPHLSDGGCVLTLQNGLAARIAADRIGRARVVVGFVNFGADRIGNGRIMLSNRGAVALGEWDGTMTARLGELWRLLGDFEPDAIATPDVWAFIWGKLAYAALLFAEATATSGIAATLDRPALLPLWRALVGETIRTARVEGVEPAGFNGFDPCAFGPRAKTAESAASIGAIADVYRSGAKPHSGVWRDLAIHRRKTEVDAQLGMVADIAASRGIATPALTGLIALIHRIEQGDAVQDDSHLAELAHALAA